MEKIIAAAGKNYEILKLLGHGKGGYSYLAKCEGREVVLKQIHHEPCAYYTFGNKIEAERNDYQRLKNAGIRIPEMLALDTENERIVKEYIAGDTVFDIVRDRGNADPYLPQRAQGTICLFQRTGSRGIGGLYPKRAQGLFRRHERAFYIKKRPAHLCARR